MLQQEMKLSFFVGKVSSDILRHDTKPWSDYAWFSILLPIISWQIPMQW